MSCARRILILAILVLGPLAFRSQAQVSTPRQRIAACYRAGAIIPPMMQVCSGLLVSTPDFVTCMNGGPCFGEGPIQVAAQPGPPYCGALGLPFCPAPKPCGFQETISCQYAQACGSPPFPACVSPQPCGFVGNLVCPPLPPPQQFSYDTLHPSFLVNLPNGASQTNSIQFASPAIPDLNQAQICRSASQNSDDFYKCLVSSAEPQNYRLIQSCMDSNQDDPAAAYVCSTGNSRLQSGYQALKQMEACSDSGDTTDIALCLGSSQLSPQQRYYLSCVQNNAGDYAAIAVCALSSQLNPEQQIGVSCAVSTGGQPYAFAACAGGRLAAREIDKCWQYGIATDQGCFGPNNELRKFSQQIDDQARAAFGANSAAYQAFSFWQNNVAMPGPNNEVVKFINNTLGDIQNGPGPNNDLVKFGNQVGDAFNSVGQAVQCIFGCQ
jgi:hypothetical protein